MMGRDPTPKSDALRRMREEKAERAEKKQAALRKKSKAAKPKKKPLFPVPLDPVDGLG